MKTNIFSAYLIFFLLLFSCRPEEPMENPIDNSSITNVFDQSGFNILNLKSGNRGFEFLPLQSGGYLFIGENASRSGNVFRFSADFKLEKEETVPGISQSRNHKAIENTLGDFIIVDEMNTGTTFESRIKKINTAFELVWDFKIDRGESLYIVDFEETQDGGYFVTGKLFEKDSTYGDDYFFAKLDEFGGTVNSSFLEVMSTDEPHLIHKLDEEKYLVIGSSGTLINDIYQAILVDTSAAVLKSVELPIYSNPISIPSISKTDDEGYFFLHKNRVEAGVQKDIYVSKLDKEFNLLWSKDFGGANYEEVVQIFKSPNGGYFMILNTRSFGSGQTDIYVAKLDEEGEILWSNTYGSSLREEAEKAFLLNDWLIIYSTIRESGGDIDPDHSILILDLDGNPI